jgi:hypothetical protein
MNSCLDAPKNMRMQIRQLTVAGFTNGLSSNPNPSTIVDRGQIGKCRPPVF